MRRKYKENLDDLKGETLTHIDLNEKKDEILLTTESGRQFRVYHEQDCCEHVRIVGVLGRWNELLNRKVEEVGIDEIEFGSDYDYDGTGTETTLTFRVDGKTLINRWIGESNGYYSEKVDFEEIFKGE